jgi:hypothetical protein
MKKQTTIMWNHLDYPTQLNAINIISKLIGHQIDPLMKTALAAAVMELEMWSNTTCNISPSLEESSDEAADENTDEIDNNNFIPKPWIH